jgi:electron transport complex protein RnfG
MLISAAFLAGFGALGTAMVMTTFEMTKEQIEASEKANLLKNLHNIIPPDSHDNDLFHDKLIVPPASQLGNNKSTTIYRAKQGHQAIAAAFAITAPDGYSGNIKLLIAIKDSGEISGVRVISHKETPGLGDKIDINKSNWILKFNGKTLTSPDEDGWKVKKDGGIYDQFTGATITPRAIVKAVRRALDYFNNNHDKLFLEQEKYDQLYGVK